jgi:hypothetical protein
MGVAKTKDALDTIVGSRPTWARRWRGHAQHCQKLGIVVEGSEI